MLKSNERSFGTFIALLLGITGIILLINNYSTVSVKSMMEETQEHIAPLEESLEMMQHELEQYGRVIEELAENDTDYDLLLAETQLYQEDFLKRNALADDLLFQFADSDETLSSKERPENAWSAIRTIGDSQLYFTYALPLYAHEKCFGYLKLLLSYSDLSAQMDALQESGKWQYYFMSTDDGWTEETGLTESDDAILGLIKEQKEAQGAINAPSGSKLYTFHRLQSGIVYVEIKDKLMQTQHSNEMIILISLFAIIAMWMIQRNKSTKRTIFDILSDSIMGNYADSLSSAQRQGTKATIALNLGMTAAIFADVIYSIALGRNIQTVLEYFLFFCMSAGVLFLYKRSRSGITEKIATFIILSGFLGSLAEHISAGGFSVKRAGESLLWFIVCLYIGLFILGMKKSVNVFNLFVVLLFLDVVLEVILFQKGDYESIYLFAISFILLGFALFESMKIYVSDASFHYKRTEELIDELKSNQSILLQKEKLSALGQLISGVAHEINTPIGAIKASAETMDSTFLTVIREILESARTLSKEEYECFTALAVTSMASVSEMKSTLEIRAAQRKIRQYFQEIALDNRDDVLWYLRKLEIMDLDWIQEHIEFFRMENILLIFEKTTKLTPFTTGIPSTIYAADKVSQIVLALKSYVHVSSAGEMIEFDVIKNIENVLILYRNQLKSNITIIRNYEKDQCLIVGNPDELAQVWTNLIQNALQAMEDSGVLTLSVMEKDAENISVMVGDTGAGISSEWINRIYDSFFTTKSNGEGSGIGLNISKKVIEKHHGEVTVESQPGEGTRFYVSLPKIGTITQE